MKKSFNPFKMWGTYVGALVFGIYYFFSTKYFLFDMRDVLLKLGFSLSTKTGGHITAIILTLLLGSLLGWGIHSLCRRLK